MANVLRTKRLRKDALVGGLLWLLSLAAGTAALMLAEFGAPAWIFVVLFVWLATIGLPTLAAILLLAWLWPGRSLQAYLLSAVLLAFLFQFGAVSGVGWAIRKWRGRLAARA